MNSVFIEILSTDWCVCNCTWGHTTISTFSAVHTFHHLPFSGRLSTKLVSLSFFGRLGRLCLFQLSLSVLMAIFPGEPGLADFIEAKNDGSGGDNWSHKTCKAQVKKSPLRNQMFRSFQLLLEILPLTFVQCSFKQIQILKQNSVFVEQWQWWADLTLRS